MERIYRSTIWIAIEPGTVNLQVDPIKPQPILTEKEEERKDTNDGILNDILSAADFGTPYSCMANPSESISGSDKLKTWQDVERGEEYHKDSHQRYFQ